MPKQVTGYFTDPATGAVSEHEMYAGDLNKACIDFPSEWSKTPRGASSKAAAAKPAKKVKPAKAKKIGKSATSPFPPSQDPPKEA